MEKLANEIITAEVLRKITEEKRAEIKRGEEEKFNEFVNLVLTKCIEKAEKGYSTYKIDLGESGYMISTVTDKFKELGFNTQSDYGNNSVRVSW